MTSTVRWYEDAVTGKLARRHAHAALDRCVVRNNQSGSTGSRLPAGLSALLRSRPVGQTWSGVPIKQARVLAMFESASDDPLAKAGSLGSVPANKAGPGKIPLKAGLTRPSRAIASIYQTASTRSATVNQRSKVTRLPTSAPSVATAPMLAGWRAVTTMPSAMPSAAAGSSPIKRVATKLPPILPVGVKPPSVPQTVMKAPLRLLEHQEPRDRRVAAIVSMLSSSPDRADEVGQITGTGQARYIGARGFSDRRIGARNVAERMVGSRSSASPASQPVNAALQAAVDTSRAVPGVVSVGIVSGRAPSLGTTARSNASPPNGPQNAYVTSLGAVGGSAAHRSFRDHVMDGQEIVPRKNVTPQPSVGGTASRQMSRRMARTDIPDYPGSNGEVGVTNADPTSSGVRQSTRMGMMVALHGDVILDSRKLGRMVAAGQTSAASLPTVSASAINLRAVPIFAGTRAPL